MNSKSNKAAPRMRYYSSYEESTIIKLWRQHLNDITSYTENSQVFGDISVGLQQYHIKLSKREVQRRISSYRNKYLQERRRLEHDAQYVSGWSLYPLVDCLFKPSALDDDLPTESDFLKEIESKIRKELPDLQHFDRRDCKTLKFEQDPDGCPFFEPELEAQQIPAEEVLLSADGQIEPLPIFKTDIKPFDETVREQPISTEERSLPKPTKGTLESAVNLKFESVVNPTLEPVVYPTLQSPAAALDSAPIPSGSIMSHSQQKYWAEIEALHQENILLEEERDAYLDDLELKEREYKKLEQTFNTWLKQQEELLACMDKRGVLPSLLN